MRSDAERRRINNFLGNRGLATLDDPRGLITQMGFLVRDHDHFRQMLIVCDPLERRNMYESLKPHLRFAAKPLDVYVSEAAADAERRQLPTVDEEGNFHEFQVPRIGETPAPTDEQAADLKGINEALAAQYGKSHLWLVCAKCTAEEVFHADNRAECVYKARMAGWKYQKTEPPTETCPVCSGVKQ